MHIRNLAKKYKILLIFLFLDFLFVTLHLLFINTDILFFNLDEENNLPTIYQGLKIVLSSIYIFIFIRTNQKDFNDKKFFKLFYLIPLVFLFLALDEVGQLHENLEKNFGSFMFQIIIFLQSIGYRSATWLIVYLPFFILFGFLFLYFLHTFRKKFSKNDILSIFFVITFVLAAILLEYIALIDYTGERNYIFMNKALFEEFFEMISFTIFLSIIYNKVKNFKILL